MRITIPGNPGDAAVNAAKIPVGRTKRGKRISGTVKSKIGRSFERRAILFIRRAIADDRAAAAEITTAPAIRATVTAYWPRRNRKAGVDGLAHGDVDAPVKATLDALERAGLFDDDVRCVELVARKFYDKANPRIEVEVTPATWPPTEVD